MENRSEALRIVSWNVAGRAWCLAQQTAAIGERRPAIVALQEVRPSTAPRLLAALAETIATYLRPVEQAEAS